MIVVADTSPINYLIQLGHIDFLQQLYKRIVIPHAVLDELLNPKAPAPVRAWALNPPGWLEFATPSASLVMDLTSSTAAKRKLSCSLVKLMPTGC